MIEKFKKILLAILFSNILFSYAQDVTESPTSTVKGAIQIEIASSYESFKEGNNKNIGYTVGSFLFLYGITDNAELRLGTDLQQEYLQINKVRQDDILSGYMPLMLGVGADLIAEKGVWPQVTLIGDIFLPRTGGSDFKQDNLGVSLKTGFFHKLGENQNAQLNYNVGVEFGNDDLAYLYTMAYLQNIGNIGGAYFELSGDFTKAENANHFWNVGFYFMLSPNLQLDTIVGTGINADQDIYLTSRLQIYIPNNKTKTIN